MNADTVTAGRVPILARWQPARWPERSFHAITLAGALVVFVLIGLVGWQLYAGSRAAVHQFGWRFLISSEWDPANNRYGALPFIFGTCVSSLIALVMAVPLSVGTAVYLTELAPRWLRPPLASVIEMLAAVPSVIWGLWGIFVLQPVLRESVYPLLQRTLGFLPLFQGPIYGLGMLTGGIIVAIMILPIVTSVSHEVLRAVPALQREAAYGLGATRWEVTRIAVLSYARRGLFGAAVLGLGRALGETMAVTMLIGNTPQIAASLFAPGYTLASVIANEFTEASGSLYLNALFELGLVLLGLTVLINVAAFTMVRAMTSAETRRIA